MGEGTRVRCAVRIIHVLRKPLGGSVARNVLEHGCGAIHIDAARISSAEVLTGGGGKLWSHYRDGTEDRAEPQVNVGRGRWPTNLILDTTLCDDLDAQSGASSSPSQVTRGGKRGMKFGMGRQEKASAPGDSGGASRYFFQVGGRR